MPLSKAARLAAAAARKTGKKKAKSVAKKAVKKAVTGGKLVGSDVGKKALKKGGGAVTMKALPPKPEPKVKKPRKKPVDRSTLKGPVSKQMEQERAAKARLKALIGPGTNREAAESQGLMGTVRAFISETFGSKEE